MYNIIFYKTVEDKYGIKRRVPDKFVFDTATNTDGFLADNSLITTYSSSMPSLNSASGMFTGSTIETVEDYEADGTPIPVRFPSLTIADSMFSKCYSLTRVNIEAPSLISAKNIFHSCNNLTSVNVSFNSLEDASYMFDNLQSLTTFTGNLDNLKVANGMFRYSSLNDFNVVLPSLVYANEMFSNCMNFNTKSITLNLPKLIEANYMFTNTVINSITLDAPLLQKADNAFENCSELTSVTLTSSQLMSANSMFKNASQLNKFEGNTFLLKSAFEMFSGTKIETFYNNLDSLKNGYAMFENTGLTTFNSALPSLTNGVNMFKGCKLNAKSVLNIIETLPSSGGSIVLGIGITAEDDIDEFAKQTEIYDTWNEMKIALINKGWASYWYYSDDTEIPDEV